MNELVEKIARESFEIFGEKNDLEFKRSDWEHLVPSSRQSYIDDAQTMLSVVLSEIKENPERFVEICSICDGIGNIEGVGHNYEKYFSCKGTGLIAKEMKP